MSTYAHLFNLRQRRRVQRVRWFAIVVVSLLTLPLHADTRGGIVVEINLGPLLARLTGRGIEAWATRHDCRISTVGYRYRGQPGQTFTDSGETFTTGSDGTAEIIATRRDSRRSDEPVDQFGFADRVLPMPLVVPRK